MHSLMDQTGQTDIYLWCDGVREDGEPSGSSNRECKRAASPITCSKCAEKERQIDDLTQELKELHNNQQRFSDQQYRLWVHFSKEIPPNVPMITGFTPTRASKSLLRVQWRVPLKLL